MNNVQLREFDNFTLHKVSNCIDLRVQEIRDIHPKDRTDVETEQLSSLIGFQTQVLYASQLVERELKVSQS